MNTVFYIFAGIGMFWTGLIALMLLAGGMLIFFERFKDLGQKKGKQEKISDDLKSDGEKKDS